MYIRGFEAQFAISQDWNATWVRWSTMPHMKKPFQMDTLRSSRQPPKEELGDSTEAIFEFYKSNKKRREAEVYWSGRGKQKPTQLEFELLNYAAGEVEEEE